MVDRKESSLKIPEILKNNIKNLTDVGDTLDTMGTSELVIQKTPSPKKSAKKMFLSRLMSGEKKEPSAKKIGDKRLIALKSDSARTLSMLSSPSMVVAKKDELDASTSALDTTKKDFNQTGDDFKFNDSFDKLVSEKPDTEKEAEAICEQKSQEIKADQKSFINVEDLPLIKEFTFDPPKISDDLVKYFQASQSNFRKALKSVKEMK